MSEAGLQYADLLLIDDILPSDFSPVRTCEYEHYLNVFNSVLVSLESWHGTIGNATFAEALARLPVQPALKQRIVRFRDATSLTARLAYVSFLHNAATLFPYFEERQMPFVLQLYPGGRFDLDQPETDDRLRRILASPLCRKVIVTQTISQRYLLDRIGCDPTKLEFIYGGVVDNRVDFDFLKDKRRFGRDKETLDLCFVAHRYGDNLAAKGFDHFIAVARALGAGDPRLRFHVVGGYTADDLPLGEIATRITFHGPQPSHFFREFYPRMDAIVSVNRPFAQAPGAFDGFPTGACVEAGFRGVLNCINDPLGSNVAFTHQKDFVLLDDDPDHTVATLEDLLADPSRLYDLAYANWRSFHAVFDMGQQLAARVKLITGELLKSEALIIRPPARSSGLDGSYDGALAYWQDQVRSHAVALRDTDRRHLELMALYRDLEQRHEALMREYRELAPSSDKPRQVADAPEPRARAARLHWRIACQRLKTRLTQRLT